MEDKERLINMKILEQIGTGMNFAAKQEIINSVLSSIADEILIIDPEREYTKIVEQLSNDKQMNFTYTNGMYLLLKRKTNKGN